MSPSLAFLTPFYGTGRVWGFLIFFLLVFHLLAPAYFFLFPFLFHKLFLILFSPDRPNRRISDSFLLCSSY